MNFRAFEKQIHGNSQIIKSKLPIILSIGNFDGFHLGHRYLINKIIEESNGLQIVILTFYPHPKMLFGRKDSWYLSTLDEKIEYLLAAGISAVVVQKFSKQFAQKKPEEFCKDYLVKYFNIKKLVLGFDFRFGENKYGDSYVLKDFGTKNGWEVIVADPFNYSSVPVSSTRIRSELASGNIDVANQLLGRPYSLRGRIVRGDERGRTLGFPTANLEVVEDLVMPLPGVYVGLVALKGEIGKIEAVINTGFRPTFGNNKDFRIEAHLLNFKGNLYDRECTFEFLSLIRKEHRFSEISLLIKQIENDVENVRNFFLLSKSGKSLT